MKASEMKCGTKVKSKLVRISYLDMKGAIESIKDKSFVYSCHGNMFYLSRHK